MEAIAKLKSWHGIPHSTKQRLCYSFLLVFYTFFVLTSEHSESESASIIALEAIPAMILVLQLWRLSAVLWRLTIAAQVLYTTMCIYAFGRNPGDIFLLDWKLVVGVCLTWFLLVLARPRRQKI